MCRSRAEVAVSLPLLGQHVQWKIQMSFEKPEGQNIDQFEDLFGPPPLLEGEDEERYMRLRDAIVPTLSRNVFDWINAS